MPGGSADDVAISPELETVDRLYASFAEYRSMAVKLWTSKPCGEVPIAHSTLSTPDSGSMTPDHVHPGFASRARHERSVGARAPSVSEPMTGGVRSMIRLVFVRVERPA